MSQKTYRVELIKFTYGGESLGRLPDGRAVFVPFALPGETVSVSLVEEKRNFAKAILIEVLQPSPERNSARCRHFGECGGCQYQMMFYAAQLSAKRTILLDQLERIGKLENPFVEKSIPSPNEFNYRNYVQFQLSPDGQLGYYRSGVRGVLPITECHLPEPDINTVWPQLDIESLPEISRLGVRLGADRDIQIILESKDLEAPEITVEDLPISIVHLSPAGTLVLAGSEVVYFEILERRFQVSAGSFFQTNTPLAEKMVEHILELLSTYGVLSSTSTAIDAYCGVGLFSAFLAPNVKRLIGIESNPNACEDFMVNLDEFDNVELYEASTEIALANLNSHPDFILVDPPRSGLDKRVLYSIVRLAPPILVYVSCDPSTLARDAKRLSAKGYTLQQVTPFDLFPQTQHIESISLWTR